MARIRKITPDDILDAVERVVVRDGIAQLSIDAVAKEAGVSKSRVVYDQKSKDELLEAVIARRFTADHANLAARVEANRDAPHPELFGRIAHYGEIADETERALAVAIILATSKGSGSALHENLQEWVRLDLGVITSGRKPRAALLSYLALSGLYYTEIFNLHRWSKIERKQILSDLVQLYKYYPED